MERRARNGQAGFTLIETLVVVMIIGILAAIAFAIFGGQRARAYDAEAKSAATLLTSALIVHHQEHETFATADEAALVRIEPAIQNIPDFELDPGVDTFDLAVISRSGDNGGGPFRVEFRNGGARRTCDAPGAGACPDDGVW